MAKTDEAPPVGFIDSPHAPDVFADEATGFFVSGGCVRITFESVRVNHVTTPGPVNRVVIGRLVMPTSGAQRLAAGLYDFLKKQGLDPQPQPPKDQMQ
jgi:hypothetical protein